MSTGVAVDSEVESTFQDFKLGRPVDGKKLRYMTYKIEDSKIVVAGVGEKSKTYEDFCDDLEDDKCLYAAIDLEFKTTDGRPTSKLIMLTWVPDTGKIRDKMMYSGSKEALKTSLNGIGIHLNCTDRAELDFETSILPQVRKFT
mmetsp:Transcript_519/g.1490  ORF Transcript_519/g.1490 Transcript_519/m.1490 type:complete len:144 (-) Transcript_519:155-586(-)|eukprot:CAMPEP_0168738918 /NCGR_PEP_ID=MMETSP0724-20121128/11186_1 /TAXON_ID=265536 /ORGANISM="Amphiprora sp., Strain CCMP467" /LENGTH=143 /DNA_ID=CAMNT_0008786287 /DNA_START=801 /DNA_END=1232 /DNA_ORIENTATION=-